MEKTNEILWMDVEELNGRYEVSNTGIVRNKKSRRLMKIFNRNGYLAVALFDGKKSIQRFVHRLVAIAFLPNPNPEIFDKVHHRDEDKINAHVSNLEWTTQSDNIYDYHERHIGDTNIDRMRKTLSSPVVELDTHGNIICEYSTPQATGYHSKEFYKCLKSQIPYRGRLYVYKHDLAF
ncbi:NUMOD4 domain-containing protein [Anaerocolumna aminovalerica]|uniref:NUMOD4 domain-containing protein n=1 Tax=Anaerocolumna aminovalerica TaxID=1527 RepID=UPI001596763A|nr:NUMOD4 domain-containing protein [Anaerocolumna aminovalerica]